MERKEGGGVLKRREEGGGCSKGEKKEGRGVLKIRGGRRGCAQKEVGGGGAEGEESDIADGGETAVMFWMFVESRYQHAV